MQPKWTKPSTLPAVGQRRSHRHDPAAFIRPVDAENSGRLRRPRQRLTLLLSKQQARVPHVQRLHFSVRDEETASSKSLANPTRPYDEEIEELTVHFERTIEKSATFTLLNWMPPRDASTRLIRANDTICLRFALRGSKLPAATRRREIRTC